MCSQLCGSMSGFGQLSAFGGFLPIHQCTSRLYPHASQCIVIDGKVFVMARIALGATIAAVHLGMD